MTAAHHTHDLLSVGIGIVTVSTTRTRKTDASGRWITRRIQQEGHRLLFHERIPDDRHLIARTAQQAVILQHPDMIVFSGGTGVSPSDVTIEALLPLFDKELTAFSHLFALLSFNKIDSRAMLSRAAAGLIQKTLVFCLPGSLDACKLALNELIFPEISHLCGHVRGD